MPRLSCHEAEQLLKHIKADFGVMKGEFDYFAATGDQKALKNVEQHKGFLEKGIKELRSGLGTPFERAREILGKDFLGPEAVFKTWNIKLEAKDIPPIPFSIEDLERAKELGQFLILRVPLTMQKMEELIKEPMFQNDWFKKEDFYTKDTSKPGWALVSKEVIPDTTNQNYIEQTQTICDYLDSKIFGQTDEMHEVYQNAIMEFEAKKQALEELIQSDWQEAAKQLSELQITKLTRQSPADVIHDLMVYKQNNDERLLEDVYTWTNARSSVGDLVNVGNFKSDGVYVNRWDPDNALDDIGVAFVSSQ